jgi:uncharacterized membrane-anchored protein
MWLIMTTLAAIITTVIWYVNAPHDQYQLGFLSLFLWGASLMWFVDHVMAYFIEGGNFFEINLDATLLGLSVITLALLIWIVVLLITDPKGVIKRVLKG